MRGTYDTQANALALRFAGGRGSRPAGRIVTHEGPHGVSLDFVDGKLVGLEVLDASEHFTAEQLAQLVTPEGTITPAEAEAEFGLAAESWKKFCQRGRIRGAVKKGRDWHFTRAAAAEYMVSRDEVGRGAPPRARKARRKTVKKKATA